MTLDSQTIGQFDHHNTLAILASYPTRGHIHDKDVDALAGFTHSRVKGLNPTKNHKIVIFTHQVGEAKIEKSPNILVLRVFKKDHPLSFLTVYSLLSKFKNLKHILIEYEFSTFGGPHMTMSFIPFLASLKNLHISTTIELHQVLLSLQKLKGHLGYKDNDPRTSLFNNALVYFYKSIGQSVDHITVLEEHLRSVLSQYVDPNKIHYLPYKYQKFDTKISQLDAKKKLGLSSNDFVVLMFGYITWYKGSDIFIKAAKLLSGKKNIKFILAGGQSHNQKHKKHYQNWYQETTSSISSLPNLTHTSFVSEKDIPAYYSAADLVVFPYRTFMATSGPLSICLSQNKPFILSKKLLPYLKSPDILMSLGDPKFSKHLFFDTNPQSLAAAISNLSRKKSLLNHLKSISMRIAKKRDPRRLGTKQRQIIFS